MIFASMQEYRASGFVPQVVIIGSGPAGTTVARRLARAKVPCVLLDAGDDSYSEASQNVYKGKTIGDPYFELDLARLRYLGGTSGHWSGWCRFLDTHDFEQRSWIPDSGWPVGRHVIEPYFDSTREILGLRKFEDDTPISSDINWIDLIRSEPVRFGEKYQDDLAGSNLIAVVLNTYVTDLAAQGARIRSANVISNRQPSGQITAPMFVAATGGIENSRLLLWSNQRSADPVVPEPKTLGRYWMEHPEFLGGDALIFETDAFKSAEDGWAYFAPTPDSMRDTAIMNFHAVIMPQPRSRTKQLVADLACTIPAAAEWLAETAGAHLNCGSRIGMAWEQAPVYENHVALSSTETDFAGIPRVELHWRKGELERKTLLEGLRLFGKALAQKDIGRLRIDEWIRNGGDYPTDQQMAGYHHMGGTRMSDGPEKGIVDANCRVHGMENLYVAGSSIFTTSGYANPTATIVAFSERLGEHLADQAA